MSNFRFVKSNSQLYNKAEYFLNLGEDYIFIFMDMIPANRDIKRIYRKLRVLSHDNDNRVIVFPIVCSEYYFIRFLSNYSYLIVGSESVDLCVNKDFYKKSKLLTGISEEYATSFEKFCKLLLIHQNVFIECLHSKKAVDNFYEIDCVCRGALNSCKDLSLAAKAIGYLSEFPCFPSDIILSDDILDLDEVWGIHRRLVDEFNVWSDSFKVLDVGNNDYFNIRYIKEEK